MPTTAARCRALALALPDTVEAPHYDLASFRTGGRIFATMPAAGGHLHVFLPEELRAQALALHPRAVEALPWGAQIVGLRVTLAVATPALVESLLRQAWAQRAKKAAQAALAAATPATKPAAGPAAPADVAGGATYFADAAAFRAWLRAHHAGAGELLVGFRKVGRGDAGLTWPQSVDEALCVGWIDGVRRRVDADRYTIRFTPRRAGSHWSHVNIDRVGALTAEGRMQPAGLAAFARRDPAKAGRASYERSDEIAFDAALLKAFRAQRAAWRWFGEQPPGYRRQMTAWVTGAKQDATRRRRLDTLIAACAAGERLR